jgi:hypothetical protein
MYFSFPPEPVRTASGTPPLFSSTLKEASGLVVDDAGHVITTRDVVTGCRRLRVAGAGFNAAPAEIQALPSRPGLDLALLRVDAKPAGVATFVDLPDPISKAAADAETGPYKVAGFGNPSQPAAVPGATFVPVTPIGMVSTPDHSNYLGFQGGLPSAMTGGALLDGKNRVMGVYAGSTTTTAPSGTTQMVGGVILSGEVLQLARSAGISPKIVDVADGESRPQDGVTSAMVQVFCFRTGFPNIEFYIPKTGPANQR